MTSRMVTDRIWSSMASWILLSLSSRMLWMLLPTGHWGLALFDALHCSIDVEEGDVGRVSRQVCAPASPLYFDDAGFFQLLEDTADHDRIDVDTRREEVAGRFHIFFEGLNTYEDVDGYGESAGYLHDFLSCRCFCAGPA